MKRIVHLLFIFAACFVLGSHCFSQSPITKDKNELRKELSEINDFITNAFPKSLKEQGQWKYFDTSKKREVETEKSEENRLISFKKCDLRFYHAVMIPANRTDLSDDALIPLGEVDPGRSGIRLEGNKFHFYFNSERNVIISKRQSIPMTRTMNGEIVKRETNPAMSSFGVTLETVANPDEVRDRFERAVQICQTLKD